MRVLGIDPSLTSTGFGVIDYSSDLYSVVTYGVIKPPRSLPFSQRIHAINTRIEELIQEYTPQEVAIENLFHAHNIKTALALGQVRGAVLVAIAGSDCELFGYSALEIKKAVTGYGHADKDQVQHMVRILLHMPDEKLGNDESDALACAFCHLNARIFQQKITAAEE
ncbi:MAG: crossover junction endodeoxyribonuclease RuvC [Candidatus Aminicenantaceae bacterium]